MNPGHFLLGCGLMYAIGVMFLGLRVFFTRRPLLISGLWGLVAWLLLFVGGVSMQQTTGGQHVALVSWIPMGVFLCWISKGYTACGVTNGSFQEGLMAALKQLGLAYEETSTGFRLPEVGAELRITRYPRLGFAGLLVNQWRFWGVMRKIANAMNEYYRTGAVQEVNMNFFVTCVVTAAFFLVLSLVFIWTEGLLFFKP
jgi:hypothetical protein